MKRALLQFLLILTLGSAAAWCSDDTAPNNYVLGPNDQLAVHVLHLDEIGSQPFRIDMQGYINLPLAGRVHAGGLTVDSLEKEIASRLKSYLLTPTVSVTILEYRSQPVSILGAVNQPGIHQLQGHMRLFEAISAANGLRADAGDEIKITRDKQWGPLPVPRAVTDPSGEYSVATVRIDSVMEATDPKDNIELKPNDVISVPRAKMVYVVGSVRRPGGFALNEKDAISVLQAISLAEGLERTAAAQKAVIIRGTSANVHGKELPVDVQKILSGKLKDMPLEANDILFVPNSKAKTIALRSMEALIQTGTGLAIYR